jgi:hypothetical protein
MKNIYFTMLAFKVHSFGKEGKLVFRILIGKDGHEGLAKMHEKKNNVYDFGHQTNFAMLCVC